MGEYFVVNQMAKNSKLVENKQQIHEIGRILDWKSTFYPKNSISKK